MPSATGIVADTFGENRDRAVAMFTSILPAGGIIGPVLGGVIVTYWSWREIFFINVPIGIIALILAQIVLDRDQPQPAHRLDWLGMALLSPGLTLAIFGLAESSNGGFGELRT